MTIYIKRKEIDGLSDKQIEETIDNIIAYRKGYTDGFMAAPQQMPTDMKMVMVQAIMCIHDCGIDECMKRKGNCAKFQQYEYGDYDKAVIVDNVDI